MFRNNIPGAYVLLVGVPLLLLLAVLQSGANLSSVLMALVTTFMTSPLLEWVYPSRLAAVETEGEEGASQVA